MRRVILQTQLVMVGRASRPPFGRSPKRVALAAALFTASALGFEASAQPFDEQRQAVSVGVATQPESAIRLLIEAGLKENKPSQAIAVAERWLRENVAQDPLLLYHAGRAAELSGDWSSASALYRQYLTRADLKSDASSDAILAVYTLLINQLDDPESAYAFARTEGHALVSNAQARQFDRWFLNEAKRRNDQEALATRLLALTKAKVSGDLLTTLYESDFNWLLGSINDGRLDNGRDTPEFIETVKELAASGAVDRELCLLLGWSVSVHEYNNAILAGEQADPPLAEANALLKAYPHHAGFVQLGWAGGNRGPHYRGDARKYWPLDLEAKLGAINDAVKQLGPIELAEYNHTLSSNYYSGRPQVINAEQAREWVLANPKLANSKAGPELGFDWNKLTPEQAKKLAPHLAQNPGPEAAMVRAVAAATDGETKDFDKAVEVLLSTEAWRLSERELNGGFADQLWHWAGRPGGNAKRDQQIARSKQLAEQIKKSAVKKEDPANKRMAEFNKLWQDYRSDQPKQPAVRERLMRVLAVTPEALPEVLKDNSVQARLLLRDALANGVTGTDPAWANYEPAKHIHTDRYSPTIEELGRRTYGGMSRLVNDKEKYKPHPLAPVFQQLLDQQLKQNKVEPWAVYAWLNTRFPEDDAASVALMQRLAKSPAWDSLPYDVRFGARRWFGPAAMIQTQATIRDAADINLICKPLLDLPADADADAKTKALIATLDALKKSPVRHEIIGLERLVPTDRNKNTFVDAPQLIAPIYELAGPMRSFQTESTLGAHLFTVVAKDQDPAVVHAVAPFLWRHTEVHHRTLGGMIELAAALTDEHPSAAQALARCGLQTIARHKRGHTYYKRESDIPALRSVRGKAALAMGLVEIPVPASHPAYNVYRSQAEFVIGNEDSARELLADNTEQLLAVHRKLSVQYLLWVLEVALDNRDELLQEELAKALMGWMQESETAFTLEQRVQLEIAYGDIALQRGLLPEAQKIFANIRNKPAYEPVYTRHTATLRQVLVQRISGDYDGALQTLMELDAEKVPRLTTEAHYARAEVYYAMEEYQDSADEVAKVLERDPNHADATLLLGRVQLKLQRLIEATEVELGSVTNQNAIVPGELLKVTLNDPTLSVSSGGTDIEVVVWATSGDREHLLLRQFGDEKTKYRGEVRTALGKPAEDDRVLQIVGDDEIYYAYSEAYREKIPNLGENRGGPIIVASDALIMASARKLLSENEQRVLDMQAATEAIEQRFRGNRGVVDPEVAAQMKAQAVERSRREAIQARVKPGNPIYLRVVDPDKGRTAEVDQLAVTVTASSGDSVARVVLKETDTHSGTFEGSVPTAGALAAVFASSSETGRNPNMLISPKTGYPAWRPVAGQGNAHRLTVDLNDNAALGKLDISSTDEGFGLSKFIVQTGVNEGDMTTVAAYPNNIVAIDKPWHPSVVVMTDTDYHHNRNERSVYDLRELQAHVATGWMTQQFAAGAAGNVAGPSEAFTPKIPGRVTWKRQNRHHNAHVVYRFRGYFYEPASVTRRFKLDLGKFKMPEAHPSVAHPAQYLLAVDGKIITSKDSPDKLEGQINLGPGLHRFEIWATGWDGRIGFGRGVKLRANLDDPDELVDCPDSFFDPGTFPEGLLDHRNTPATIEAGDGGDTFEVAFAPGSRARLIRILPLAHEGPVPSINRLALTDAEGGKLLPMKQDFAELRKNELLEIITGDRVTVRYVDDRFVTKGKQKHERFLNVAFTDGEAEFADIEPRFSSRHNAIKPYYEELLRFVYDKPLPVVVNDADMDVTVQPDKVKVAVSNGAGQTRELLAEETGPSTGVFRAWVTPVQGPTSDKGKIGVAPGGRLTATYNDAENLRPGVPTERVVSIDHAPIDAPRIEVGHMTVEPIDPDSEAGKSFAAHPRALNERLVGFNEWEPDIDRDLYRDTIVTRYRIVQEMLGLDEAPQGGLELVHGRHAMIEIVAPHLALGTASSVEVFVQSDAGRAAAGGSEGFNPNAPGTMRYVAALGNLQGPRVHERGGYTVTHASRVGNDYERARLRREEGRFRVAVPLITGALPNRSFIDPEEIYELRLDPPDGLVVKTGERMHIGVSYRDGAGKKRWATASAKVITRPMLDVMEEDYRSSKDESHVGEKLFVRVVDLAEDRTEDRDEVRVYMQTKSGAKHYVTLTETEAHSGVFKSVVQLTYAKKQGGSEGSTDPEEYDVRREGFPVVYGDAVGVQYTDASGLKTPARFVTVLKGADGTIAPFSKQYTDATTAMKTQFAMAESYLELARRHRSLGEEEQAVREFDRAKQLLASTITQFNEAETRAHAEYLLGNLTVEDAEVAADKQLQQDRYQAALARYMKVTGSYPDTAFASKAQFKIALVYEALGEPDIAAQEYVKLAYKHPESEHLATAMARLGTHFQRKAVGYDRQAKPLLEQVENKDAQFDGEALRRLAVAEYTKSAQIFERLQERFPDDELAGKAGLRAGQIYMRAGDYSAAVKALKAVIDNESYDGATLRAEAMYWAGMSNQSLRQALPAYALFKRITYDFPESKWAAYARAQLSTEQMLNLDYKLEVERLEAGE